MLRPECVFRRGEMEFSMPACRYFWRETFETVALVLCLLAGNDFVLGTDAASGSVPESFPRFADGGLFHCRCGAGVPADGAAPLAGKTLCLDLAAGFVFGLCSAAGL